MLKIITLDTEFVYKPLHILNRRREKGVVLLIALIALVAMTLAAIALVRSVDTTNIIAGNLAFQQSAKNAGDIGSETAINWLQANNGNALRVDNLAQGYAATWNSSVGSDWGTLLTASGATEQDAGTDIAGSGNSVTYIIQRMCAVKGVTADPNSPSTGCAVPAIIPAVCKIANCIPPNQPKQRYYRITTKVVGPRNTVSYIQTIVAL